MKWLIFLLTLLLPINAMATEYHVATDGSGDYTTVVGANAVAVAGDTIALKCGDVWLESLSASSDITYTSYGTGNKPKLNRVWFNAARNNVIIKNISFNDDNTDNHIGQFSSATNIIIDNCDFTYNSNRVSKSLYLNCIDIASTTQIMNNFVIKNCSVNGGDVLGGINIHASNYNIYDVTINNNTISNVLEFGIQGYADSGKNFYNLVCSKNTINIVSDRDASIDTAHGINFGFYVYDSIAKQNYISNCAVFGIVADSGSHDIDYINNILINNKFQLGSSGNIAGNNVYNLIIYNNTLYSNSALNPYAIFFNVIAGTDNVKIKNNIVISYSINNQEIKDGNDNVTNLISDYNLWYETLDSNGPKFDVAGIEYNFTDWKATSQDSHSIAADPLLNTDYTLKSNSPCIDAGVNVGIRDDYTGNPRPDLGEGNCDIGAFEMRKREISINYIKGDTGRIIHGDKIIRRSSLYRTKYR